MAADYPIEIDQGATWRKNITIKDNQKPAVVIDLTGVTIVAQIRERYSDSSAIAVFVLENQDLVNGTFDLVLPFTVTETLIINTAFWDLEILFPNNDKKRYLQGTVDLSLEATK